MSNLADRITKAFGTLETMVTNAEQSKDANQEVRTFCNKVNAIVSFADGLAEDGKVTLAEALGENLAGTVETIENLRALHSIIGGALGIDRTEGDTATKAIQSLLDLNAFDDEPDTEAKAKDLVARWQASAPTKSAGKGSTNVQALPFTVRASCMVSDCKWDGTKTDRDNLNSIRDICKNHAKVAHKVLDVSASTEFHKGLTEALNKVMHEGVNAVDGGTSQIMVTRS